MYGKVVLGLSDGVDSAVAAALLRQEGYDVTGVYLDISDEKAREDAMRSACETGIRAVVMDVDGKMEEYVRAPFASEYALGRTPNPCIGCNPMVKFAVLTEYADEIGAEYIASGHYVRKENGHLYMGKSDCDQSYMLQRLRREQAARLILPLGRYDKTQVRAMAESFGITAASKPDSRENCFIRTGNYIEWLEARGNMPGEGAVLYKGREIGRHGGIHRFTVGQRWPEILDGRRLYVGRLDPQRNTAELVLWEDLFRTEFDIRDISMLESGFGDKFRAAVRVRHTRWETPECTVFRCGDTAHIVTDTPVRAPCPGQACALYSGKMLLGGGYIS